MEDRIICPLINIEISCVECMENQDTKEDFIPEIYKKLDNWKEVCKNCKYNKC